MFRSSMSSRSNLSCRPPCYTQTLPKESLQPCRVANKTRQHHVGCRSKERQHHGGAKGDRLIGRGWAGRNYLGEGARGGGVGEGVGAAAGGDSYGEERCVCKAADLFHSQDGVVATLPVQGMQSCAVQQDILVLIHTAGWQADCCMPLVAFSPLQLWPIYHDPGTCCSHACIVLYIVLSQREDHKESGGKARGGGQDHNGREGGRRDHSAAECSLARASELAA